VAIGEKKTGGTVVKFCAQPAIEKMTLLAIAGSERRAGTWVIRIGGALPIFQMARIAPCRQTEELPDGGTLVTGIAWNSRVGAEEWEPVLMLLDLLGGNIPTLHGVTLLTI
jgi:hypothetical protein